MAGVGFELKKLFRARTATGHLKAYTYSTIITAGPFLLLTGMVLGIQLLFAIADVSSDESALFVASVVYAFVFSQILSSGFTMVLTRYLADCLSVEYYEDVTGSLFGMCALLASIGSVVAALFYWGTPLSTFTEVLAYTFFLELLIIWVESVYLTAVKKFKRLIIERLHPAGHAHDECGECGPARCRHRHGFPRRRVPLSYRASFWPAEIRLLLCVFTVS